MDNERNPFSVLGQIEASTSSDLPPLPGYPDTASQSTSTPTSTSTYARTTRSGAASAERNPCLKRRKEKTMNTNTKKCKAIDLSADVSQEMETETPPESEPADPFARIQAYMEKRFNQTDANITKMNTTMSKLGEKVGVNTRNLTRIKETVESNARDNTKEISRIHDLIEKKDRERKDDIEELRREFIPIRDNVAAPPATEADVQPASWREKEYWTSRRKARFWPVKGSSPAELWRNLETFLLHDMRVPTTTIAEKDVMEVVRVLPKPPSDRAVARRTREHDEVLVTFSTAQIRDTVCSYARNLSSFRSEDGLPTAGVRKEIPEFLVGVNRALLHHGSILKRMHGKGFRRNIKFDDSDLTLYMDVCLPGENSWLRVDYAMALEGRKEELKKERDRTRNRLASSQSDTSETENFRPPTPSPSRASSSNSNMHPRAGPSWGADR